MADANGLFFGGIVIGWVILGAVMAIYKNSSMEVGSMLLAPFKIFHYFLPYILFIVGPFIDSVLEKFAYTPASILGILSVVINHLLSLYFYQRSSVIGVLPGRENFSSPHRPDEEACGIPGLSYLGSAIFPQSIVFNTIILSYISSYTYYKTNDPTTLAAPLSILMLNMMLATFSCKKDNYISFYDKSGTFFNVLLGALLAFGTGWGVAAGVSYATPDVNLPKTNLVSAISEGLKSTNKCSEPNEEGEVICEA